MWHCCCSSSPHVRDFLSLLIRVLHQKRQHHHQQPCRTLLDVSDIYLLFIIIYSRVQQHRQPHPGALSHVRNHATINKIYPLMASICNNFHRCIYIYFDCIYRCLRPSCWLTLITEKHVSNFKGNIQILPSYLLHHIYLFTVTIIFSE